MIGTAITPSKSRTRAGTSPRPYPIRLRLPLRRRVRAWACPRPGTPFYCPCHSPTEFLQSPAVEFTVYTQGNTSIPSPQKYPAYDTASLEAGTGDTATGLSSIRGELRQASSIHKTANKKHVVPTGPYGRA